MLKKPIYVTDQETMLPLMQRNVELNNLQEKVKVCAYSWGTACPESIASQPDVVLAADCVYFEPAFPLLLHTLQELIGPSTVCYFCFKRRRRADMHFVKAIRRQFVVADVEDDPDQPKYARENIYLYAAPPGDTQSASNADIFEGVQFDGSPAGATSDESTVTLQC